MYKRITAAVLLFVVAAGITALADYRTEYPWAVDAVEYCVKHNILRGDENGDFMLGSNVTQAEGAALINRSFQIVPNFQNVNVPANHWGKYDIDSVSGYLQRPGDFAPDMPATREMFISTLMGATGFGAVSDTSLLKRNFSDIDSAYPEYLMYLASGVVNGFVQGSEGKLFPKDFLTRAEAITLIYRVKNPVQSAPAVSSYALITGKSTVSLESAKAWARSKNAHQRFIDIADIYWKYGEIMGIRPEVMYAQAARETGYGKYGGRVLPEMNNWAGIKKYGATGDETEDHETFATPDDGVRGHFNHMSAYVGVAPVGETHGRYRSVKSLAWAGTVKTVYELGGKWCPDTQYGYLVMDLVNEMSAY